jgi:pyruvate formate lyase activating enzyme
MKEAVLWTTAEGQNVCCKLCRWACVIAPGKTGRCKVRQNIDGVLYSLNYDKVCSVSEDDPVEKKPLFHFLPGSRTFSISAPGCNFQCVFCQNWQISQAPYKNQIDGQAYTPQQLADAAVRSGCKSVAYTYTEPTVFMELCAETATLAKQRGLYNIFVSNGYMSMDAIQFVRPWLDAINIDLKAFTEDFYRDLCKARLEPVLETIRHIAQHTDIWMELTTLLIPGKNDSSDELSSLAKFIVSECGQDTPWHISRFYPQYKLMDEPATTLQALQKAYDIGRQAGLRYVYVGNLPGNRAESTFCHACGKLLIERTGYHIITDKVRDCACPCCGAGIAGLWP